MDLEAAEYASLSLSLSLSLALSLSLSRSLSLCCQFTRPLISSDRGQLRRRDQELFLQDLEEDPELRGQINLYRDADVESVTESDVEDEGFPEVRVDELLDDFAGMALE